VQLWARFRLRSRLFGSTDALRTLRQSEVSSGVIKPMVDPTIDL